MSDLFSGTSSSPNIKEGLERLGWKRLPFGRALGYGDWERPDGSTCTEAEARSYWETLQKEQGNG